MSGLAAVLAPGGGSSGAPLDDSVQLSKVEIVSRLASAVQGVRSLLSTSNHADHRNEPNSQKDFSLGNFHIALVGSVAHRRRDRRRLLLHPRKKGQFHAVRTRYASTAVRISTKQFLLQIERGDSKCVKSIC